MADGMIPGLRADGALPFCETHRAMLDFIATSSGGGHIDRTILSAALRAAAAHHSVFAAPTRLRVAILDGRQQVFLWPEEARAVLDVLPPPPAPPPAPACLATARRAMITRAYECFALAESLGGPGAAPGASDRANRIGERMLLDALALDDAAAPVLQQVQRIFGRHAGSIAA
ncbi:hypothetical protein [Falsiroseomonas sp.]|uniref:hypothetical protein n=1 Tax=Falsiroseomonas sp. TaxID=2870721 RepID=UPI0027353433|nr:hypothetical protein [Falsiroseomonas sp.]MDP3417887.1 hypothetical protein [Falsiroseomonas sp.]